MPSLRRGVLALVLLVLSLQAASVAADDTDTTESDTETGSDTETETETMTPSNAQLSGCQVCAASGNCSQAYLDSPGRFCGTWVDHGNDKQSCCCPQGWKCKLSTYECKCARKYTPAKHSSATNGLTIGLAVGFSVIGAVALRTCYNIYRKKRLRTHPRPSATPPVKPSGALAALFTPGVVQ